MAAGFTHLTVDDKEEEGSNFESITEDFSIQYTFTILILTILIFYDVLLSTEYPK